MLDNVYYKEGIREEVSKTHEWRTAVNSLGFALKYVKPADRILDVGCGPGSITNDLAQYVPQGEVIGVDTEPQLIDEATKGANLNELKNVKFEVGSAMSLPFNDSSFDVVFAHQVLLHIPDLRAALMEMRRVAKKGGIVCCRDADLDSLLVYPRQFEDPIKNFFVSKSKRNTTSIVGGRELKHTAINAGFLSDNISYSCSNWCIAEADQREWFRKLYADRVDACQDNEEDLYSKNEIQESWKSWASAEDGVLVLMHGEIICRK